MNSTSKASLHSITKSNVNLAQNSSHASLFKNQDDYIYDSLGGENGISAAIDKWSDLVLENNLLKPFFSTLDMTKMKALQRRYIMLVLTQHTLPQRDVDVLVKAHSSLELEDAHFDAMKDAYMNAFLATGGSHRIMVELALDRIEKTRDMILGRYKEPAPNVINHHIDVILTSAEMSVIPENF